MTARIRDLEIRDAPAVANIYNDAVLNRLATFDEEPTPLKDFEDEIRANIATYPSVAVEDLGNLVAYAISSSHSPYGPYRGIAEFSVYVAATYRGRGLGKLALSELIKRCEDAGFSKLLSRILADNRASRALCSSLGFREVGTYERHAQLYGKWHDVIIVEKLLEKI